MFVLVHFRKLQIKKLDKQLGCPVTTFTLMRSEIHPESVPACLFPWRQVLHTEHAKCFALSQKAGAPRSLRSKW